jgi:hypothetical protein
VTIDETRVTSALLSHEARVHRFGWDQEPQMVVVYDIADQPTDYCLRNYRSEDRRFQVCSRAAGYAVKAIITRWPVDPTKCLRALALGLAGVGLPIPAPPLLDMFRLPGVVAIGWVDEAWTKLDPGREFVDANLYGNVSVRDMPDSKEQRVVWALDLHGRMYTVLRTRGGRPVVHTGPGVTFGAHTTMLKMIIAKVTDTLPPREEWPLAFPDATDLFAPPGSPLREGNPACP